MLIMTACRHDVANTDLYPLGFALDCVGCDALCAAVVSSTLACTDLCGKRNAADVENMLLCLCENCVSLRLADRRYRDQFSPSPRRVIEERKSMKTITSCSLAASESTPHLMSDHAMHCIAISCRSQLHSRSARDVAIHCGLVHDSLCRDRGLDSPSSMSSLVPQAYTTKKNV